MSARRPIYAAVAAAIASLTLAAVAAAESSECDRACRLDLEKAKAATAKYQDVSDALREGFVPVTGCDQSEAGVVGYHLFNDRNDRKLDVQQPELLIYLPIAGELRLVAIEYFQTVQKDVLGVGLDYHSLEPPEPVFEPADPPTLFGQRFEGPMAHDPYPTMWHYDLHVWAWQPNPNGIFAHYNPALSCTINEEREAEPRGRDGGAGARPRCRGSRASEEGMPAERVRDGAPLRCPPERSGEERDE